MNYSKKFFFPLIFGLVFSLALFFGCTSNPEPLPSDAPAAVSFDLSVFDDSNQLIFSKGGLVKWNSNAFEAMKIVLAGEPDGLAQNLEFEEYPFGIMVTSIAQKKAPSTHYWALYVDNNYASQGIADYVVTAPMKVTWRLEKIESFGG